MAPRITNRKAGSRILLTVDALFTPTGYYPSLPPLKSLYEADMLDKTKTEVEEQTREFFATHHFSHPDWEDTFNWATKFIEDYKRKHPNVVLH